MQRGDHRTAEPSDSGGRGVGRGQIAAALFALWTLLKGLGDPSGQPAPWVSCARGGWFVVKFPSEEPPAESARACQGCGCPSPFSRPPPARCVSASGLTRERGQTGCGGPQARLLGASRWRGRLGDTGGHRRRAGNGDTQWLLLASGPCERMIYRDGEGPSGWPQIGSTLPSHKSSVPINLRVLPSHPCWVPPPAVLPENK